MRRRSWRGIARTTIAAPPEPSASSSRRSAPQTSSDAPAAAGVPFTAYASNGARLGAKSFHAAGRQSLFAGGVLREIAGGEVSNIYFVIESSVPGSVYVW